MHYVCPYRMGETSQGIKIITLSDRRNNVG